MTMISTDNKIILFYQPGRYAQRPDSKKADAYFEKIIPCKFLVAETWDDFVFKLNLNPDIVGFHSDLFNNEEFSTQVLIKTIETTLKLKDKHADIFVTINKQTSKELIDLLRKTNIAGVQLGRGDFGLEVAAESYKRLLEDKTYWPEDKINALREYQENKRPLHIYFGDDLEFKSQVKEDADGVISDLKCNVKWCKNLNELSESVYERPKSIAVHIDIVRRHGGTISEFMMMLETLIKYSNVISPNIGIVIESDTHLLTIKELRKHRILGIIPSVEFNKDECVLAINNLVSNIPNWPKHIIDSLPGNEQKTKNKNNNALTGRQQEVFDLIARRGLSNKQIARVLNISESTVKIHVSAVMKNLCVRNRTQLALTK